MMAPEEKKKLEGKYLDHAYLTQGAHTNCSKPSLKLIPKAMDLN